MQPLLDLLAVHGVAAEDAIISGERRLRFAEQKTATLSGVLCDSYEPYISALSVGTADGVCVPLPPDGPDFSALAAALPKIKSLPLYEILQEPGSPPPDRVGSFSITAPAFLALVKAEDDFMDALINGDDDQFEEVLWTKFQYSDAFAAKPCARELFVDLNREYAASRHIASMLFSQYYEWFHQSAETLDASGAPTPDTMAKVEHMLDAWTKNDAVSNGKWLVSNLDIHPRHASVYRALAEARAAASVIRDDNEDNSPSP